MIVLFFLLIVELDIGLNKWYKFIVFMKYILFLKLLK